MSFMQKQSYSGVYYSVETREGTTFIPANVCGRLDGISDVDDNIYTADEADTDESCQVWDSWCSQLSDYVRGEITEISQSVGKLYRLSAPGYMDCTEWTTDPNSPEFEDDSDKSDE